ncbi:hypothetical protein CJU89_4413 [Yarrowia sp. B02]|nr:hypothetical protein CJU89_4413 [Yarrowia sp. B02]
MDYHPSDLFQMATEPWCDDYVAQYGSQVQYPTFSFNLPYDDQLSVSAATNSHGQMGQHVTQQHHVTQNVPQQHHVTPQQHHVTQQQQAPQQQPQPTPVAQNYAIQSPSHVTQQFAAPVTSHVPVNQNYMYSSVPYEDVYVDSSTSSDYLLTQPYVEVTSATTSPSDYDTPHASSVARKQPESRMSQPELFSRMGLSHDPEEARNRENRVLSLLKSRGFKLGEQTWIRDTTPAVRQEIVDFIHASTVQEYGYSKYMIEVVIRRACYHLMQGRLRRIRRARKSKQN